MKLQCNTFITTALSFLLLAVTVTGCSKSDMKEIPIIDPVAGRILSADTIRAGSFLGMNIGDDQKTTYQKIQQLGPQKNVDLIWVTNPQFSGIETLKGKLDYYSNIRLSNKWAPSEHVLFFIESDKIKGIYNPNGKELPAWPVGRTFSYTIRLGDGAADVYKKLQELQSVDGYKDYFSAISVFGNYLSKPYDSRMTASGEWYLNYTQPDNKSVTRNTLLFKEGALYEIRSVVEEIRQ